jgi:spermidine synthase
MPESRAGRGFPFWNLMNFRRLSTLVLLALTLACASARPGEKLLVERSSPYNASIVVTEDGEGLRTLSFGNGVRQSVAKPGDPDHLELAYTRAIPAAFLLVEKPQSALVIGLGGGSIPMFLRRHFPDLSIDAVDIDPVVVELAKSHMGFREDANMRAYVEDGRSFVERSQRRYDLIFVDAFGAEAVPYRLVTREFLEALRRALTPRGAVVANIWDRDDNPLYDSMVRTYAAVFDEVSLLSVRTRSNVLVLATPWKPALTRDEAVRRAAGITRGLSLRDDLVPIIERGWGARSRGGNILTDEGGSK